MSTPVYIDDAEKNALLKGECDAVWALDVEGEYDHHGTPYSYDFLVVTNAPDREPVEIRIERKTWPDFVSSWHEGRLDRQLECVDALLLELDLFELSASDDIQPEPGWSNEDYQRRLDFAVEQRTRALKHLARISKNRWLLVSFGPAFTISILRYIEANPDLALTHIGTEVPRRLLAPQNTRQRILEVLPGVNTGRRLADGRRVGDVLEALTDWPALERALHLGDWLKADPFFSLARIKTINEALLRGNRP